MIRKYILPGIFLFILFTGCYGQNSYRQAGLRAGYTGGFFYQKLTQAGNGETGLMAMLSFRGRGLQFTGMKIFMGSSLDEISPDLFFGWGFGGHAGFISGNPEFYSDGRYYYSENNIYALAGIDALGFLEYRFREIPVAINLNIKPFFEIELPSHFLLMPGDIGISVAYYF